MSNINLVTGFWHIRNDRSEEKYLNNFKNVLSIPHNMTIFIPKKYENMVIEYRKNMLEKTDINILELEDIKTNYFSKYWDKLQKIRTNPEWVNSTHWLKNVPQSFSEWYNPIVMSKVFFINTAHKKNIFNSETYIWVDAGITQHIPKEYVCYNSVENMAKGIKKVFFTAFEYKNQTEVHGFDYKGFSKYLKSTLDWVCRATIFGCKEQYVDTFVKDYDYYLKDTLDRGYLGTEESIFTLLSGINPSLYNVYNMGKDNMPSNFLYDLTYNYDTPLIKNMIHIITHILPQEIDQLEQLLIHLKKSSVYVDYNDYIVEVVLNTKLTDWSNSKLDEQFFIDKFKYLEKLTNSWCETKFEVSDGSILGCNDIRRRALRTSKADYIMYLDVDNIFSETLLFTIKEYCKLLNQNDSYDIIVPQTTRMWDTTWDIITSEDHLNEEATHENYFNRDPYLIFKSKENTSLEPINGFKFAGWGTVIPTKLRKIIDIPDSLGSYGLDDTFVMYACNTLKQKGHNINQWVINGEVIIENNKFRYNPYQNYLATINRKDEFLNQAHSNFNQELQKYLNL